MDPRELEALVRDTYRALIASPEPAGWGRLGDIVSLAELRSALPADLPREEIDAALLNLASHADVHLFPRADQDKAHPNDRDAALLLGGAHQHALTIEETKSARDFAQRLNMSRREPAESMVAALDDTMVVTIARMLNVEQSGDIQQLRERLVNTSVANHDAWMAAATQQSKDGNLLYRAENDPGSLSAADRREVTAAAQRHAGNPESFGPMRERAERWLTSNPSPAGSGATGTAANLARSSFGTAATPAAPPAETNPAAGNAAAAATSSSASPRTR